MPNNINHFRGKKRRKELCILRNLEHLAEGLESEDWDPALIDGHYFCMNLNTGEITLLGKKVTNEEAAAQDH